jgi:hypothetical protein
MQRLVPGTVLALAITSLATSAMAQPTLEAGFGGPNDFGSQCLSPNDDGSSRLIDLTPAFPSGLNFFGTRYMSVYVNTNGNISFGDPVGTYTPEAFPIADQPMIAPYWADVDLGGEGSCTHGEGDEWATCMLSPGDQNGVYWALEPRRMVVTWDRVGYFLCHDDLQMSFQLLLTAADSGCGGSGDFDVEFRYTQCGWNTGDASGGTNGFPTMTGTTCTSDAACDPFGFGEGRCEGGQCWDGIPGQAGFDAGNRTDYVEIAGSRTNNIHTILCETSNVGEIGVWRFQIRSGAIICPGAGDECATGMPGVCADGRTRCVADHTECRPLVDSTAETCDLLDNDCDGMVDDGDICPGASECVMGTCVATCFEGACPAPLVCDTSSDRCVEDGCIGIECPPGERCTHGVCGDACAGIVCPFGLSCEGGRCIDLCEGASCDDCNTCDPTDGSCTPRCTSMTCATGETCAPDGTCIPSDCFGVTCGTGTHCVAGDCIDDCDGTLCPTGQECRGGVCAAIQIDAGPPGHDAGAVDASAAVDAGVDAGSSTFDGGSDACVGPACLGGGGASRRGCACAVPGAGEDDAPATGAGLFLLGLALVIWRRGR